MATDFWVELRGAKYDANSGWHCSALTLPGAEITKIVVGGNELPLTTFTFDAAQIRFVVAPQQVPDGAVKVALKKRLITIDTAIVVAVLTLLGTLGSAWLAQRGTKERQSQDDTSTTQRSIRESDNSRESSPMPARAQLAAAQDLPADEPTVRGMFSPFCMQSRSGIYAYCGFETLDDCQSAWSKSEAGPFKANHSCVHKPATAHCFAYKDKTSAQRFVCLETDEQCESARATYRSIDNVSAVATHCQSIHT